MTESTEEPAYPQGLPRVLIAVILVLLAVLTILGAVRGAQSVPDGTPIPACSGGHGLQPVQPCKWSE
jgi:hypothetical protein